MDFLAQPFKQFKIVIACATLCAVIYVFNTSVILLQPLLLFSTLMVCGVNIVEIIVHKKDCVFTISLYIMATLLAGWGLWLSIELIQNSSRIVEYGNIIH